jgi:hypothetical protein
MSTPDPDLARTRADAALRMYEGAVRSVAARAAYARELREAAGVSEEDYLAMRFEEREAVLRKGRRKLADVVRRPGPAVLAPCAGCGGPTVHLTCAQCDADLCEECARTGRSGDTFCLAIDACGRRFDTARGVRRLGT